MNQERAQMAIDDTQALLRAAKRIVADEIGGIEQDDPRWVLPVFQHLVKRENDYRDLLIMDIDNANPIR